MTIKITPLKTMLFFSSFTLFSLLTACSSEEDRWTDVKGETVKEIVTNLDAKRIISFRVVNPGESQALYSAVDNVKKTITVYLPSFYEYQYLETAIALPEKTTITPAATELLPVFSKTPVTYTTKAADGTTAVYTVKIMIQQAALTLKELSTETSTFTVQAGASIKVTGENFVPSYEVTKLFIVDKDGNKKLQLKQYNDGVDITSFYVMYSFDAIETGLQTDTDYWLMMESYNITKTMKYPFRITN
ncbi:DUF5018 domain-containing protein [Flavobacterium bizetiae]|uniref:DUF5018 domain-containing protein n=1 Tax=Flavobacterium bizetiae TaxID=2704140 RepID=UPI0021E6DAC2|nr:DUF5018 domain-containing protein [Flavobacterium bizetiae]UTN03148.1 DUF5018 domain-containing protein [Flavobacterium bizetiae]